MQTFSRLLIFFIVFPFCFCDTPRQVDMAQKYSTDSLGPSATGTFKHANIKTATSYQNRTVPANKKFFNPNSLEHSAKLSIVQLVFIAARHTQSLRTCRAGKSGCGTNTCRKGNSGALHGSIVRFVYTSNFPSVDS